jgi:nucleotide-binding universal stress UspA family protein
MFGKIMLGYDDSEPAKKALDLALDLASKYRSSLDVVSVVRPPEYLSEKDSLAVVDNSRSIQKRMLQSLRPKVDALGVNARFEVLVGSPGDQLLHYAEHEYVDLIIVGHTGKSFLEALRMGSVSKQVMQHAPCAVLVVR